MNFKKRLKYLTDNLPDNSLAFIYSGDVMYKTLDQNFPFEVDRNFYYLTGINEPSSALLISKLKSEGLKTVLFKPITDPKRALWEGVFLTKEEASLISGIKTVYGNDLMLSYLFTIMEKEELKTLYLASYEEYYMHRTYEKIHDKAKAINLNIQSLIPTLAKMRLIKSSDEIDSIKNAINITRMGLDEVLKNITNLKNEKEAQTFFEKKILDEGGDIAFDTIAAGGKNATILHYSDNNKKLLKSSLLLLDLGASYNFYNADISRTYPISGKFTKAQKDLYEIVLKANKECIKILKPGITFADINKKARDVLSEELIKLGKMSTPAELAKYYYHSIGHPLGLDVHDIGGRDIILQEGMVITIEPGLYFHDEKIGIRIEDDVLITKTGYNCLSSRIIKEVKDIEDFIAKYNKKA